MDNVRMFGFNRPAVTRTNLGYYGTVGFDTTGQLSPELSLSPVWIAIQNWSNAHCKPGP